MLAEASYITNLRTDKRVTNFEKTNLRSLQAQRPAPHMSYPLIVMDLSFISLRKVLREAWQFLETNGRMAALVKPQFECHKEGSGFRTGCYKGHKDTPQSPGRDQRQYAEQNYETGLKITDSKQPPNQEGTMVIPSFSMGWERLSSILT